MSSMKTTWLLVGIITVMTVRGGRGEPGLPADLLNGSVIKVVQAGRVALAAGDLAKARSCADVAVSRDSGYADAWKLLGAVRLQAGETNAAAQAFRTALLIAPRDLATNRELGWLLWDADREKAIASFDLVVRPGNPDRDATIRRVLSLLAETEQEPRALELFRRWNPGFTLGELGSSLVASGRQRAAYPFLDAAFQSGETRPDVALQLAALEARKGGRGRALACLKSYFAQAPASLTPQQAELFWATVLAMPGTGGMNSLWEEVERRYPADPPKRAELAAQFEEAAARARRWDDTVTASELYRQALILDPNRGCWADRVLLEERLSGAKDAERQLRGLQSRATLPATREAMSARLAHYEGRSDEAIRGYRACLGRAPGQLALRVFLIRDLFAANRVEEAREETRRTESLNVKTLAGQDRADLADFWYEAGDVSRALELDPVLLTRKAQTRALAGDWEGMLRLATLAVTNQAANGEAWRQIGLAQSRLLNYAESRQAFERVLALNTNDVQACQELGWTLWGMGEKEAARDMWNRAVGLGVRERIGFVRQVVARMAEENRKDWALECHRLWLPATAPFETGVEFFRTSRMKAAEPFLAWAWDSVPEADKPLAGLYLGRARSINGVVAGTPACFMPFIQSRMATASVAEVTLVLDGLSVCAGAEGAAEALAELAEALSNREDVAQAVTGLTFLYARDATDRKNYPAAMGFYETGLRQDPNRLLWPLAWDVAMELGDEARGIALLAALETNTTSPAVRSGIGAKLAERRGDLAVARTGYEASLAVEPAQPVLHRALFDLCLKAGDLDRADREAGWVQAQVDAGDTRLRELLALMRTRLGQDQQALDLWRLLHLSMPDERPYYGTEMAMAQYRTGQAAEALETLKDLVSRTPVPLAYELMTQIHAELGQYAEAVQWASQGLSLYSTPALRRALAESLEALQTPASAVFTIAAAKASVQDDPGYASMALLGARAMALAGQSSEAADWQQGLLARNPEFAPGLMFLRDYELAARQPRCALPYAERLAQARPSDDEAVRRYAMNLAEADGFSRGIRILDSLASRDDQAVMAVLLYDAVSPFPYAGLNTVSQMVSHIEALASAGYRFTRTLPAGRVERKSVMIVLVEPESAVVDAVDAVLQLRQACAVMIVSPDSLVRAIPRKPPPARLAQLAREGRWTIGVTAPSLSPVVVRADGVKGHPLTHRLLVNGVPESAEAMSNRVHGILAGAAAALETEGQRLFFYPRGDYGQLSLDTDSATLAILSNTVAAVFSGALCLDDNGFVAAGADPCRLPAKSVPPAWSDTDLLQHLREANPVVKSRLELAKICFWHGQTEVAAHWLRRAGEAGANPFEVSFNRGANAAMAGDLPVALEQLREAIRLAPPGEERPARLLEKTLDRRRPVVALSGSAWWDNEDRSHGEVTGSAEGPVSDWLRWNAAVGRHEWETKTLGREEATQADLGLLAYVAPEIWLKAGLQEWYMDSLPDLTGWDARLHLPSALMSGHVELSSRFEMMETVEALRKEITAHREGIDTYSRVLDFWDCFLSAALSDRSDGNDTWWVNARVIRRLKETPYVGVGYAGRYADSSLQAPEYWSPEQLQQHQAYAALQATGTRWSGQVSGQAGYAMEQDTDWRFVWGGRVSANYKVTRRLSAGATALYQAGPIYDRTSVDGFLSLQW